MFRDSLVNFNCEVIHKWKMIRAFYLIILITYIPSSCQSFPHSTQNRQAQVDDSKKCSGYLGTWFQYDCFIPTKSVSRENNQDVRGPKGSYDSSVDSDAKVDSETNKVNGLTKNGCYNQVNEADNVDENNDVNDGCKISSNTDIDYEEGGADAKYAADEDLSESDGVVDDDNANLAYEKNDADMAEGAEDFKDGRSNTSDDADVGCDVDGESEKNDIHAAGSSQSNGELQWGTSASQTITLKCTVDQNKIKGGCSSDCDAPSDPRRW